MQHRVLVVGRQSDVLTRIKERLEAAGYLVESARAEQDALALTGAHAFDALVVGGVWPSAERHALIRAVQSARPGITVVDGTAGIGAILPLLAEKLPGAREVIRVAAICGSLRPGSLTRAALRVALAGAAEVGAETELIDLADYDLVFCHGKVEYPEAVERLRAAVRRAQGLIWGTPEYHGGYSGVLKNALDLMGFAELEGKIVGLVGVSGGALGAAGALAGLRAVGRALHAWVIPEQVSLGQAWKLFDEHGEIADARAAERLADLGRHVTRFTYLHSSSRALEFLRAWESAQANPGAELE